MTLIESFSGIRGLYGPEVNEALAEKYATAFARHIKEGPVVLGGDTRPSTGKLLLAFKESLGRPVIEAGVVPVPVLSAAVPRLKAAGGVHVTASHNPVEQNGWKLFTGEGSILSLAQSHQVIALSKSIIPKKKAVQAKQKDILLPYLKEHREIIEQAWPLATKVLVDPNGGAAIPLLKASGMPFKVINGSPGAFAHELEPSPKVLSGLVPQMGGMSLGASFDCDADRAEFVLPDGTFVSGNVALAIIAKMMLSKGDRLVVNDATSFLVRQVAEERGAKVIETEVGETHVVSAMAKHGAKLGGEGSNGGIIFPPGRCRDGFLSMLWLMKAMLEQPDILAGLPPRVYIKEKVPCSNPDRALQNVLSQCSKEEIVRQESSVKVLFGSDFLWFRQSKTEGNVMRVIVDASTEENARKLLKLGLKLVS
ncbi:MAG: hypothetical protein V1735_06690 [Nanoarchaeota archaeon]